MEAVYLTREPIYRCGGISLKAKGIYIVPFTSIPQTEAVYPKRKSIPLRRSISLEHVYTAAAAYP